MSVSNCCFLPCIQVSQGAGKVDWYSHLFKNFPQFVVFTGGSVSKESAWNAGDLGSVPGSGRSPGKEMATHSSILAWRIPWSEEPARLQSMGLQESDMSE